MSDYNQNINHSSEQFANEAKEAGKAAARKAGRAAKAGVRKVTGAAIKKAAAAAAKAITALFKAIVSLLAALGPVVLIILAVVLVIAIAWNWTTEERGTRGDQILDTEKENVLLQDENGNHVAVALSKEQAYMKAYYSYMSCSSYEKTLDGNENLTFRENTADFAGLQDYYEKEGYFYLSSNFIKMADEKLHKGAFFYPEQIIKPVPYEIDETGHLKLKMIQDEDGAMQVQSKKYDEPVDNYYYTQTDEDMNGVWDYGLGSMLQYGKYTKDKYVDCEYTSYEVDVDEWIPPVYEDVEVTDSEGNVSYESVLVEPGYWEHYDMVTVNIPSGASADEAVAQYESVLASWNTGDFRAEGPGVDTIRELIDQEHHIEMWLEGKDIKIGARTFDAPSLQVFSNLDEEGKAPEKYPLNIPLLDSVVTFSGDITYTYELYTDVGELQPVDSSTMTEDIYTDPAQPIDRIYLGESGCGYEYWILRTGDTKCVMPRQVSEEDEPCGATYLEQYSTAYSAYVPLTIQTDTDFVRRIDSNGTNHDLLTELGLLVKYSEVSTEGSNYSVFAPCGMTGEQLNILLEGTAMEGTGPAWAKMESDHGVNAVFALSVARQESGLGTSNLAQSKNNLFGITDGHGGWQKFSSKESCVDYFGKLISQSGLYFGKSIDQISVHYCTSDPSGWAKAVKSIMSTNYNKAITNGIPTNAIVINTTFSPISSSQSQFTQEEIDRAVAASGYDVDELYQNVRFDAITATNMLQTLTDPMPDDTGHFAWLGKIFSSINDLISGFFETMAEMFDDNMVYEGERVYFSTPYSSEDIEDIVYQAMTLSTGSLYTTIRDSVDTENLNFLFVGKESMFAYGTGFSNAVLVPGVGCRIDGFISPTSEYYQTISPWSAAEGGAVLATPMGTKILSVADGGRVLDVINQTASCDGYTVIVEYEHEDDVYQITFKYLKSVNVSKGKTVNSGALIGYSGSNSDGVTGLFFGMTKNGTNVDPLHYFYQPTYANNAIVQVALSQLGNVGGYPYKNWYPLSATDPWCAAFVSWCADQCGYINAGVFPKFCGCSYCIDYYLKPNNVFWSNRNGIYTPHTGDLIFFDWETDGRVDHVGIIEYYENGVVHTVEGNTSNSVRQRTYSVTSSEIFGYGLLDYQTQLFAAS